MATVRKRGNSYQIRSSRKYDVYGRHIDEYTYYRCVGRVIGTLDPSWVVE